MFFKTFFNSLGLLWNRVVSTTSPWMTTKDSLDCQPPTFKNTMFHHRLNGIL